MPFIYKITNKINNKVYIGKTIKTVESRWKQHCLDCKKERNSNRPLYRAMRKYGIENFNIEPIEECSKEVLSEREMYWIKHFDTYKNGYNATTGGDGTQYCDYDEIYKLYQSGLTVRDVSKILGYTEETCRTALHLNSITRNEIADNAKKHISKSIAQIDVNTNETINVYASITDAYNSLGKKFSGHIADVCSGKRKSAYGYRWEYVCG